ncbi:MAG: S49 family peptidase [Legionellales bacterium]|nr:S49 family peptidase [Legionellales bacterium]|tara:strand:+ start:372 stop:1298 length:927 start_codon:yes stop_codon:yes gene_type:complete
MFDRETNNAIYDLLGANLVEQRRARRWKIFFRFVGLIILLMVLYPIFFSKKSVVNMPEHIGVIEIEGVISAKGKTSYNEVSKALKKMYKQESLKGVILDINSQGGLPAQASLIYDEIRRYKEVYPEIPVYAAITDVGASAAYYIAAAADEIVAAPSSIVGSIGVVSFGFGVQEAMKMLGVESRTQHAGEHKVLGSPFDPLTDKDKAIRQEMLDTVHMQFIEAVKQGRGDRLSDNPDLFSGLYWTGEQALDLGLVDSLSSRDAIVRDVFNLDEMVYYNRKRDFMDSFVEALPDQSAALMSMLNPTIQMF